MQIKTAHYLRLKEKALFVERQKSISLHETYEKGNPKNCIRPIKESNVRKRRKR
jgi:hypothetical protein